MDYTCPHCGKNTGHSARVCAPATEIIQCDSCNKWIESIHNPDGSLWVKISKKEIVERMKGGVTYRVDPLTGKML